MIFKNLKRVLLLVVFFISASNLVSAGNLTEILFGNNLNNSVLDKKNLNIYKAIDTVSLNPSNCGQRPFQHVKIVGGTRATAGDWGWQVLMLSRGSFICGGSLINSQWIVTAAHCAEDQKTSLVSFRLGLNDRSKPESWSTIKTVSKMFIHPSYNSDTAKNDIALFKLSTPISYSNYIIPVCVPTESASFAGATSWATGWGSLKSEGSVSRYLMQVSMPFLTDARCKKRYTDVTSKSQVCAGEVGQNKDTCQGDSGGPLVVKKTDGRWYLGGITSYGDGCGDGGVYTRASYYYNWILSIIKSN